MYETGMGALNIASIGFSSLVVVFFLVVWFFLSRASVRANEQIRLLQEIAEQQKQQIELLNTLVRKTSGNGKDLPDGDTVDVLDFKGFIPER